MKRNKMSKHKLNQKEKNKQLTKHHRYPDWLGGTYHRSNILVIEWAKHQALHLLTNDQTGRATTPIQQLQIIKGLLMDCLTPEFNHDFDNAFKETDDKYYYKNGIYRK